MGISVQCLSSKAARLFGPEGRTLGPIFEMSIVLVLIFGCLIGSVSNPLGPATPVICFLVPGIFHLDFCTPPRPDPPISLHEIIKGLQIGSKLAEIQAIAADGSEIPHLLQISELRVGSMLVRLGMDDWPLEYVLFRAKCSPRIVSMLTVQGKTLGSCRRVLGIFCRSD